MIDISAREAADKHLQFLSQLLPILKPEQREKLAARMEKPPMARGSRAGMQRHWEVGHIVPLDEPESEEPLPVAK